MTDYNGGKIHGLNIKSNNKSGKQTPTTMRFLDHD